MAEIKQTSFYIKSIYQALYIGFDYAGKLITTEIFEKANFFKDESSASKVITTLPKKIKRLSSGWQVCPCERHMNNNSVEYIDTKQHLEDDTKDFLHIFDFTHLTMSQLENMETLKTNIEAVYNNHQCYADLLELYNRQQCDILHLIENGKLNAVQRVKVCNLLKQVRTKRRQVKNALRFIQNTNGSMDIQVIINEIKAIQDQKYHPRALPELFEEK